MAGDRRDRGYAPVCGWVPRTGPSPARPVERQAPAGGLGSHLKEGSLTVTAGGDFARVRAGTTVAHPVARSARAELRAVLEIRDALAATLDAQAASGDDEGFGTAQRRLNRAYDAYVDRFGPLSRFALARTGRTDPDSGEELMRRKYPAMGGFRQLDPDYPAVLALEAYDPDTDRADKMPVFSRRVVGARPAVLGAETATDALAVCLDERGTVDLARVAELLGADSDTAAAELGELVWTDPASGALVPAGRYLSGDVRAKLAAAETAASTDARFVANVTALRQVLPADLGPEEIAVRLGTPWLDVADVEAFIAEVLDAATVMVERSTPGDRVLWAVQVPRWERPSVTMTSEWGTRRADAITLLEASLEQRAVKVTDENPDGRRVVNPTETLAAREKQEALEQRFARLGVGRPGPLGPPYRTLQPACSTRWSDPSTTAVTCPCPAWPSISCPAPIRPTRCGGSCPNPTCCWPTRWGRAKPPPWSWPPWSCAGWVW